MSFEVCYEVWVGVRSSVDVYDCERLVFVFCFVYLNGDGGGFWDGDVEDGDEFRFREVDRYVLFVYLFVVVERECVLVGLVCEVVICECDDVWGRFPFLEVGFEEVVFGCEGVYVGVVE